MPWDPPKIGSRENVKEKGSASQTILKNEKSVQKKLGGNCVKTFRTLKQDVKKMMWGNFPVQKVFRMNFSTRFSNSSGNFKPFEKKNRRNPSRFSPEINGWRFFETRLRNGKKVDKIANYGPFLIIFFLIRLNFSWGIRKSGLKIHRKTLKVIFVFLLCAPQ